MGVTEQERYLTALVWARGRLSQRVCARVRLQKEKFLRVEFGMLRSRTVHFKAEGGTTGVGEQQADVWKSLRRPWTKLKVRARRNRQNTHMCARHRGLIGGANKSRAPAESPRRNGFHFASSIDGPPGSFHCLCASGDSNLKTASRATITLRSNHTAGGEALEAVWGNVITFFFCNSCMKKKKKGGAQYHFSTAAESESKCEILYPQYLMHERG